MDDVGVLVTTRLASLCLERGRPRGLAFDDHVIRAALVVDLAIGGALTEDVAMREGIDFPEWTRRLVEAGVWIPWPR